MPGLIYGLCAISAIVCAYLLLMAYARTRYKLLLWSGLCFAGLALNNLLLVTDKLLVPEQDLALWRSAVALLAMSFLLYGVIWDAD